MPLSTSSLHRRTALEVVVLIGLQASGKSTFYRRFFSETHQMISKDLMKNSHKKSVRQERLLRTALNEGRSVVIDNTNPTPEDREKIIQIAKSFKARTLGYFFIPNLKTNLTRNRSRNETERVPDVALFATSKKLRPPLSSEGFDEIWFVRFEPKLGFTRRSAASGGMHDDVELG
jgi:predicted kinase